MGEDGKMMQSAVLQGHIRLKFSDHGYNKGVSPILSTFLSIDSMRPVRISMTLLKVVAIAEEHHTKKLQFQITLEWKENRATYHNLKKQLYLNALSEENINRLCGLRQRRSARNTQSVSEEGGIFERSGFEVSLCLPTGEVPI